jgi:uncharacterized protein
VHPLVREKLPQIIEICKRHKVRRLSLFGSALREDFDPERSDVDLLIDFAPLEPGTRARHYLDLIVELEDALGRPADVVESHSLRNPIVQRAVQAGHQVIYDAA